MLPLTEGQLRFRPDDDDEDSLSSDGSFFSATEVRAWAWPRNSAGRPGPGGSVELALLFQHLGWEWGVTNTHRIIAHSQSVD